LFIFGSKNPSKRSGRRNLAKVGEERPKQPKQNACNWKEDIDSEKVPCRPPKEERQEEKKIQTNNKKLSRKHQMMDDRCTYAKDSVAVFCNSLFF